MFGSGRLAAPSWRAAERQLASESEFFVPGVFQHRGTLLGVWTPEIRPPGTCAAHVFSGGRTNIIFVQDLYLYKVAQGWCCGGRRLAASPPLLIHEAVPLRPPMHAIVVVVVVVYARTPPADDALFTCGACQRRDHMRPRGRHIVALFLSLVTCHRQCVRALTIPATPKQLCEQGVSSLFCCNASGPSTSYAMYSGPNYVYYAQADRPDSVMRSADAIDAARRSNRGGAESGTVFASVVGELTGLNFLSSLRHVHGVVLFDINPWMVEYAEMIVELVRLSPSRWDWVGRLFSRNAAKFMAKHNGTQFTNALEEAFYAKPVDEELKEETARRLPPRARCVFLWLTAHVSPDPLLKAPPTPRRVCERIRLSDAPRTDWSEKLDVGLVDNVCADSPPLNSSFPAASHRLGS